MDSDSNSGAESRTRQFISCNILEAFVSSNCPQGGDSGHGGRTVFRLKDISSTDMSCEVKHHDGKVTNVDGVESVSITLRGDSEHSTLIEALEFAAKKLRMLAEYKEDCAVEGWHKMLKAGN